MLPAMFGNLFSRRRFTDDRKIADAVDGAFRSIGDVPPDTSVQWDRLNRALASLEHVSPRPAPRLLLRYGLSAAAAALVIVAGLMLFRGRPSPERFATHRGEQLHVILPDSSEIILSHTTSVAFDRSTFLGSRSVTFSGEAYFVVRRTGSPFVVTSGAATVTVLGTEFNLKARDEEYEVGVNEGSVGVTAADADGDTTVLVPSGRLLTGVRGRAPDAPASLDGASYPGWRHGRLMAERASLASVCREIEDRFNVTIQIRDPALAEKTLSGLIVGDDASGMVATLARLAECKVRHDGNAFTLD